MPLVLFLEVSVLVLEVSSVVDAFEHLFHREMRRSQRTSKSYELVVWIIDILVSFHPYSFEKQDEHNGPMPLVLFLEVSVLVLEVSSVVDAFEHLFHREMRRSQRTSESYELVGFVYMTMLWMVVMFYLLSFDMPTIYHNKKVQCQSQKHQLWYLDYLERVPSYDHLLILQSSFDLLLL